MGKNFKGGKKHKRGKNTSEMKPKSIFKDDGQVYARVLKILGNGRFTLQCFNKTLNETDNSYHINSTERLGIIRGKMRNRVWINNNDIVIASLREYEAGKVDIIHKYNAEEHHLIKSEISTINETSNINFSIEENEDSEEESHQLNEL